MGEIRGSCPEFPDNSIRARERSVVMRRPRRALGMWRRSAPARSGASRSAEGRGESRRRSLRVRWQRTELARFFG